MVSLIILAYIATPLVDKWILRWTIRDLDMRSKLIAQTIEEPLGDLLSQGSKSKVISLFNRVIRDERLFAIAYCDEKGQILYRTPTFPPDLNCSQFMEQPGKSYTIRDLFQKPVHLFTYKLVMEGISSGALILVHDISYAERRSADTRKYLFFLFVFIGVIVSLITVVVAQLSWQGWMRGVRAMLRGVPDRGLPRRDYVPEEIKPLVTDLRTMLRSLEEDKRLIDDLTITWNPDNLRNLMKKYMKGDQIIVVSNREPYIHVAAENGVEVIRPASGLVTAIEPILKACSGTWIAHGSGSADRQVVDEKDHVLVPPAKKQYTLRRVWLTEDEESGYYYGFSNEGLWPLCHIAHVRPVFRSTDWQAYVKVNRRFAEAVVEEARSEDPLILVQDYHFALLPEMIRQLLPRATIISFWHIPWPNPESFGICPWREEIILGLLGSTIIGFHTQFHCRNFLDTVDRYLETRIERETSTIIRQGQLTMVESYPISIQWPPEWEGNQPSIEDCRKEVCETVGIPTDSLIGLGVDRLDYTKGLPERLRAVERMLELRSEMIGRFRFIQIAAPSRSILQDYQALDSYVRKMATEINDKFRKDYYEPIIMRIAHHEPEVINRYYRAANVCLVTSLHDGMNLVAKEYVAARDDEKGVLILSQFTGAAHELHESLIVNPYHIEQTAEALYQALTMPEEEQRERMRHMRALVKDFNVYRWAGRLLIDASRVRQRERLAARLGGTLRSI